MAVPTDPNALLALANQYQTINTEQLALQIQIYLLQQLAGNGMTPQQLIAAANQYQVISDKNTLRQIIVYLLQQVA